MDNLYFYFSRAVSPLIPLWLMWRSTRGKEDPSRRSERFGKPSSPRPEGTLIWIHAASVGEANSVLSWINLVREHFPHVRVLITTGTRTSAALMRQRLPKDVIHQYVPVDTPGASARFMKHWRPDFAFFVESELWPNLIHEANRWQCFMGIINARMSARSFAFWQKHPRMITSMLKCFDVVFAQSDEDAARLERLGAKNPLCIGNLKYDAHPLPCDEQKLLALKKIVGDRPVWLAASTHPGEEKMIANVHAHLLEAIPNLLTIIVPRHPERGLKIAAEIGGRFAIGLRSRGQNITPKTGIYIADTLGELGLFYRLSEIVFMGGSLVRHGGQNPLEPARLACAILTGTHTHNFFTIYRDLEQAGAVLRVHNTQDLATQIELLIKQSSEAQKLQESAKIWLDGNSGAAMRLLTYLRPALEYQRK